MVPRTGIRSEISYGDVDLFDAYERFVNPSYPGFLKKMGICFVAVRAEGATITDNSGKTYIDCTSGFGIFNIGHNNETLMNSMIHQLQERRLLSRPFISEIQIRVAETLSDVAPGDLKCSFLCNSGAEAIDGAIKLARLSTSRKSIVAACNSFHGYTLGALAVSGIPSFRKMFEPMLPGVVHVPFGDIASLEKSVNRDTAAVLLEPVQHEAGVVIPPKSYMGEVRRICDREDVLLIVDEVKTGLGKTGRMFAVEHFGIVPDLLVLGKTLGGGMIPTGAIIGKKNLWKRFGKSFPMSASSYAGNVLACRAALETIAILQKENLIEECEIKGRTLKDYLYRSVREFPDLLEGVDGIGLLLGLKAKNPIVASKLVVEMVKTGIVALPAFGNPSVIMFEPPLVISEEQILQISNAVRSACLRIH